ncbi:MAG: Zn-dependent hydrolase or glyoxylase,metallo-beta-lactamase superfamily, partial [Rhizobacter sp.]|nr:Zn-dependent hydrolase or glyoxylase,metallo-beta-lactamase superfamily [Rhizobacter sp.]
HTIDLPLIGAYQAANALVSAGFALATGGALADVLGGLSRLQPVRGRLERAAITAKGAPVYVDYAHTPDGLKAAIEALRPHAGKRLIVVFGAGGDRDTGKRPEMGAIAVELADHVIITDDNPRSEEPAAIRAAILAAAPGPITRIIVTHTHKDHSPAAAALKAATGAPLLGQAARHSEWQDTDFQPDQPLVGGERIELAPGTTLRVIHTPGHASNHLCFLLEEERLLFTGDHVMQGSTVVINPPDGDMSAYMASLTELADVDLDWLAPGHGFLIDKPSEAIRNIIAHRLKREAKVLDAVRALGPAPLDTLLTKVYDDVAPHLHPPARRSLVAHLAKLKDDGAVVEGDGAWALTDR